MREATLPFLWAAARLLSLAEPWFSLSDEAVGDGDSVENLCCGAAALLVETDALSRATEVRALEILMFKRAMMPVEVSAAI